VLYKIDRNHSVRASYNRAFRSPSTINNLLLIRSLQPVDLRALAPLLPPPAQPLVAQPFPLVVQVKGNPDLTEETLNAYELSYVGTFGGKTTLTVAAYLNDLRDNINLVNLAFNEDPYTAAAPPPGWLLPPAVLQAMAANNFFLPRTIATYKNIGPVWDRGLEVTLDHAFDEHVTVQANYSWQDEPEVQEQDRPEDEFPRAELAAPAKHRFNAAVLLRKDKFFGSASVSHAGSSFWTDVLTSAYHGTTDAYTMVNATAGVRVTDRVSISLKATNLLDEEIQQHIFGDILKRNVVADLRLSF
jgi:outer membrane receptor protein involved in Fe transport